MCTRRNGWRFTTTKKSLCTKTQPVNLSITRESNFGQSDRTICRPQLLWSDPKDPSLRSRNRSSLKPGPVRDRKENCFDLIVAASTFSFFIHFYSFPATVFFSVPL